MPLTYLDVVVDSLLKGLDQQFNSMKYNLADSLIRVLLVLCLLRFFGMESYVGILFFSTIFNASLSLHRLIQVSELRLSLTEDVLLPLLCAATAVGLSRALLVGAPLGGFPLVLVQTGVSAAGFAAVYFGSRRWLAKGRQEVPGLR